MSRAATLADFPAPNTATYFADAPYFSGETLVSPRCWSRIISTYVGLTLQVPDLDLFVGWGSEPDNGSISHMPGESELILPANTRLYVQNVTTAPSTRGRGDADGFGNDSNLTHIVHAVILPTH
jgi:hypothetical protein